MWWDENSRDIYAYGWRDVFDVATNDITESELSDYGLTMDDLRSQFDVGYVDRDASYFERKQAREDFLAYVHELSYEFNEADFWDAWRSHYELTSG